jgi:alpha-L-fucosidase 2
MLLQSHTGVIKIFPAIPSDWSDVSFENLRTYGAFLVSAKKEVGKVKEVKIHSTVGGIVKILNPFDTELKMNGGEFTIQNNIIEIKTKPGQTIRLSD